MTLLDAIASGPANAWDSLSHLFDASANGGLPAISISLPHGPFALAIGISLVVLTFALVLKHFINHVVEDERIYLWAIAIFLIVYVFAAFGVSQTLAHS